MPIVSSIAMEHTQQNIRYRKLSEFFYWLIRRTCQDVQIQNQAIAEYLTLLLVNFCRTEMLYSLKNAEGKSLETVVEMLLAATQVNTEAENESREKACEIYKHIGDYIMFKTGIFKEYVERVGCLDFYFREGELAYRRLFTFNLEHYRPEAGLFLELSRRFEFYSGALHYMRKTFFREPAFRDPFSDFSLQLDRLI
jgi:hypothetical protein